MVNKVSRWLIGMAVVALLLVARTGWAQEHPSEHPSEHPEHPKKEEAKKADMTMEELSKAIKAYVANDSELKGGSFLIFDPVDKKVLQLTLAKVHEEKLASLGDGVYFACADFNTADKHVYDLDVFMEKDKNGNLVTTEVTVHKLDGKPRYTWFEDDGVWKKKKVSGK